MHIGALVVDDEADIRTLVRLLIEAADRGLFVAGEAADGEEALERIDELEPTVVVLDERMPGMSGVETAKLILEKRPGQLIVLCSAFMDPELRARAEAHGIRVCLTKGEIGRLPETLREVAAAS